MAQAQATLDAWHQLLTKGVVQFVVKQFREQIKTPGKAGGGEKRRALQRVRHVRPAVRRRQNLSCFMGRDGDGGSDDHDSNAVGETSLHRGHTIDSLAQRKDQASEVCRCSVIDMAFDLLGPAQQLRGLKLFTGNSRAQKQPGHYRGRAAAEPNSNGDLAFDRYVTRRRGSVETLSREAQSVKDQVGGIQRKAFWSLALIVKAEVGRVGRDEQRFQMQLESQP